MAASSEPVVEPGAVDGQKWRYFWFAIALAVVYSAAHIAARMLASSNLGEDDPLTNVLVQSLEAGYSVWQPPLFEWVVWVSQQITGPSLLGFQLVKYSFLIGTIGALYLCAYKLTRDAPWSVITAEALTLIYHVGWRFHEGFTGIVPAMFFSALALLLVLRIIERIRVIDFVALGLVFGLGLLSTHNYAIGIASFLIAARVVPEVRGRIFHPALALSVLVAALVSAPYYGWIVSDAGRMAELAAVHTIFTNPIPNFTVWKVVRKSLGAPFGFYWSLLILLLVASWRRVFDHFRVRLLPEIDWASRPLLRFLGWYAVAGFALLFISGIAVSHVRYANHDLLAFLPPTLILMFALIHLLKPGAQEVRRWAMLSLAIILFAFGARAANMFVMDPVCSICRWGIPYAELAAELRDKGLGPGPIITFEPELAGNLRMQFPTNKIELVSLAALPAVVRNDTAGGKQAIVWQVGGRRGIHVTPDKMVGYLRRAGIVQPPRALKAAWRHVFRPTGYRHTVWNYVIVD